MGRCPDEVLGRVLGHLHQPFHYHSYSNVLLGTTTVPKPWNPVGLQLVCRRWRRIARPQFYRQLSLNVRNTRSLAVLEVALRTDDFMEYIRPRHPAAKTGLLVVCGSDQEDVVWESVTPLLRSIVDYTDSRTREVVYPAHPTGLSLTGRSAKKTWVYLTEPRGADMMEAISSFCRSTCSMREFEFKMPSWLMNEHTCAFAGEDSVAIRLPAQGLLSTLRHFLRSIVEHPFIPHLEFDFPFPLTPALLDSISPILKSILRHPSLHIDRIPYLLEYDNPRNTIAFKTHTYEDAQALRTRIKGFGELELDVEVNVLDL